MNVPIPQLRVRAHDLLQGTVRREWGALRHCADCLLLQGSYRCCSYKKDWKNNLFRQLTYKFSNFFPNPRHRFERKQKRKLYFGVDGGIAPIEAIVAIEAVVAID